MKKLEITEIKIHRFEKKENSQLLGTASITLNDCFAIHNIKILNLNNRFLIGMPSQKIQNKYFDICHPINSETRQYLENAIIGEYLSSEDNHG